jgi:hypothetical protein
MLTGQDQKPGPADLLRACDRLQRCQTDPDLAGLRDDKELTKLPEPEQKDWRRFWAAVRALDAQARAGFRAKQLSPKVASRTPGNVYIPFGLPPWRLSSCAAA